MADGGSRGPIWQPGGDKYTRLDPELQSANSQFIDEQQNQQQVMQYGESFCEVMIYISLMRLYILLVWEIK